MAGIGRVAYHFAAKVTHGTTATLLQVVPADGVVERMQVRLYAGPQLALHLVPYIKNEAGDERRLVKFIGKAYLDGDDDVFSFTLREPVHLTEGDSICIEATNTDAANDYDYAVDVEVNYSFGAQPDYPAQFGGGV